MSAVAHRFTHGLALLLVATALPACHPAPVARAATTITVTGTADELDANGVCSLREAIQAANTDTAVDACPAGSGADRIVLAGTTYQLGFTPDPRTRDALVVTDDLTLTGAGPQSTVIVGHTLARALDIQRGTVTIAALTIHGLSGAQEGGAIRNAATLTIADSQLSGGACLGGVLFNDTAAVLTVRGTVISDGRSIQGCVSSFGGGIYNRGMLLVTNSVIANNQIGLPALPKWGAQRGSGGGLFNAGSATLDFVSIVGNTAVEGDGGGVYNLGTLRVANSLLAGNDAEGNSDDCFGHLETAGHNVVGTVGTCRILGAAVGDILGRDARLAAAGGVPVWLLNYGSPAIDAADSLTCPTRDAFGSVRPIDGNADGRAVCDIGAYETPAAQKMVWMPRVVTATSQPRAAASP